MYNYTLSSSSSHVVFLFAPKTGSTSDPLDSFVSTATLPRFVLVKLIVTEKKNLFETLSFKFLCCVCSLQCSFSLAESTTMTHSVSHS